MLSKVDVRTRTGALLSLPLDDISNGIIVKDIEGLGPVKATLVSSSFAGLDGEQYQSSRREKRNIIFTFELDPVDDTPVRTIRNLLYTHMMPKSEVQLEFYLEDGLEVLVVGRVESLEPDHFTAEPSLVGSIVCFESDFIDPVPVVISSMTTADVDPTTVEYPGTVETGIQLLMNVDRSLDEFTIYHTPPGGGDVRQLDFAAPLVAGDVLTISTVPGSKGATLVRGGTESSVLHGISPQANWIELEHGTNLLQVYAEGAGIPVTVQYITRYGGL